MESADALERLNPEDVLDGDRAAVESLELHKSRYEFAAKHAPPGRLLDLACGVGYGTRLLADCRADLLSLTGVDISVRAIEYAESH